MNERAIDLAARELLVAAGRPELFIEDLTEYELEAWRSIVRRVVATYMEASDATDTTR